MSKSIRNITLAIDFDNTITKRSPFPITGELNEEAKKYILKLKEEFGCRIVLFTARTGKYLIEALKLCQEWGIPIDDHTSVKGNFVYIIDDRTCKNYKINWKQTYSNIKQIIKEELWNEI